MKKVKEFSISVPLVFTNKDLSDPTDLGCVDLYSMHRELGYATFIQVHIVVSKNTMLPVSLNESQIIFDKIVGSNKEIPQEKYFTLRFSEKNKTGVYTPDGKLTIFEEYNPVEADYYCGKNIIAFSPAWSSRYLYFDPITGKKVDIASMIPEGKGFKPKEANGDLEICVFKDENTSYDSNIVQRFTVSEDFKLKEIEMV